MTTTNSRIIAITPPPGEAGSAMPLPTTPSNSRFMIQFSPVPPAVTNESEINPRPSVQQPSETSRLAGITFENARGRFVCLYWQSSTITAPSEGGDILESTFIQRDSSWQFEGSVVVSSNARTNTPLAAVCWANGRQRAVYYLSNEWNLLEERVFDAADRPSNWKDGELTSMQLAPRSNSSLAASLAASFAVSSLHDMTINVYYQDWDNLIVELQRKFTASKWEPWGLGSLRPFVALSGTSIAAIAYQASRRSVYILYNDRQAAEVTPQVGKEASSLGGESFIPGRKLDRDVTLTVMCSSMYAIGLFINDGQVITAKICQSTGAWLAAANLPTTGPVVPKQAFVVLGWPAGIDAPQETQAHLFGMKPDGTVIYTLKEAPGLLREFPINKQLPGSPPE